LIANRRSILRALTTGSWNDTRLGWTAGAGVEAALAPSWKVRGEYRFTDLGRFTRDVPLTRATTDNSSSAAATNVSASFHTLRLGVAYSF
jgi:outer membrane immunogenic protein